MLFCLQVPSVLRYFPIVVFALFLSLFNINESTAAPASADVTTPKSELSATESIRTRIAQSRETPGAPLIVAGITLSKAVATFYEQRQSRLAWNEAALAELLTAIESIRLDGLTSEDYNLTPLRKQQALLAKSANNNKAQADLDLLATDAFFRVLYHLFNGKVDLAGTAPQWDFDLASVSKDAIAALNSESISAEQVTTIFTSTRPNHPAYRGLRAGLIRYRALYDLGGWQPLPPGPSLKPGMVGPQIAALRKRLEITGEYRKPAIYKPLSPVSNNALLASGDQWMNEILAQGLANSGLPIIDVHIAQKDLSLIKRKVNADEVFDDRLVEAVKLFQREQYLEADGSIGPATRAALNVSVQARIAQIRLNLDRMRWLLHNLPSDIVLVDIAGFKVTYFKSSEPIWRALVQVGMALRTTPLIKSAVNYITLNPTWTVPPTILRDDVLPKVRKDIRYLTTHKIRVLDSNGVELDPATIDWNRPGNIILRQDSGSDAALGKAVIRFPNNDSIYLHDTPHQELFVKSQRAFSSGCIRVERALELVTLLLAETPGWDETAIQQELAVGKTKNVTLAKRVPIMLAYWTVDSISEERIAFKPDIYDRDSVGLAALNKRLTKL